MEVLDKLSLKSFVWIENVFTWFYATPDTRKWKIKVNHCHHREFEFELEGWDLQELLAEALAKIELYEVEMGQVELLGFGDLIHMNSIEKVRECKKETEKKICDILKGFEAETGVSIYEVDFHRNLQVPEMLIDKVWIDVRL